MSSDLLTAADLGGSVAEVRRDLLREPLQGAGHVPVWPAVDLDPLADLEAEP